MVSRLLAVSEPNVDAPHLVDGTKRGFDGYMQLIVLLEKIRSASEVAGQWQVGRSP